MNALSEWLEVEICNDGKIYQQRYERGKVVEKLTVIGTCELEKTGTKVTFLPDKEIFEDTVYDFNTLKQRLREMARSPVLPAAAEEILRVEQIRENRTGYAVTCQLRRFDQTVTRRTCFVIRGLEDQETLLHLLELREGWSGSPELRENHTLHGLLLSVLAAGVAGVLCVLSHPAVGQLPVGIYSPCLAAAFGAVCGAVWFGVRQHRGE